MPTTALRCFEGASSFGGSGAERFSAPCQTPPRWRSSEVENASAVCLGDCLAASAVGGVGGAAEARALSRVALIEAIELSEAVEAAVEAGAPPQSSRPSLANARDGRAEMALEAPLVAVARSIVAAAAASGASVVAVTAGAGVHEAIDEAADDARAANPTAVVETATAGGVGLAAPTAPDAAPFASAAAAVAAAGGEHTTAAKGAGACGAGASFPPFPSFRTLAAAWGRRSIGVRRKATEDASFARVVGFVSTWTFDRDSVGGGG